MTVKGSMEKFDFDDDSGSFERKKRGEFLGFENLEVSDKVSESIVASYNAILEDSDFYMSSGNNAVVFKLVETELVEDSSSKCVKVIWDDILVNPGENGYDDLPDHVNNLRRIDQEYFEEIRSKKRRLSENFSFIPQADPETEATNSNNAYNMLQESECGVEIPYIENIVKIHRSETVDDGDSELKPYSWWEESTLLVMETVDGMSLEDLILSNDEELIQDYLSRIDYDSFVSGLEEAIRVFHNNGLYHNDLSIRNIMMNSSGGPAIIDFGASEHLPDSFPSDSRYDNNAEQLRDSLRWLMKFMNDPAATKSTLEESYERFDKR